MRIRILDERKEIEDSLSRVSKAYQGSRNGKSDGGIALNMLPMDIARCDDLGTIRQLLARLERF